MVAGQVSDIEAESSDCSSEMLEYIHINKTAALIKSAIKAGLYFGNPDREMLAQLDIYAENLGLAYQIVDDILDETGTVDELGKPIGSDKKKNKTTYISINGMQEAHDRLDELTEEAVEAIARYYDNAEFFRDLVLSLKVRKH